MTPIPQPFITQMEAAKNFLQSDTYQRRLNAMATVNWAGFYTAAYQEYLNNPQLQASEQALRRFTLSWLEATLQD